MQADPGRQLNCVSSDTLVRLASGLSGRVLRSVILAKMSPTSLKRTFKQLQEGSGERCFWQYAIDCFVCLVLVDKHHGPKWRPSTLEVSEQSVDDYFLPLGEHDLKL
uniref:3-hydroxyisobutyryl-CoA hydrolase n=1 Tax=Oncorhynchus tshawytscha TaxID=74940 RepID=A0AAZ3RQ24_ONCTS